MEKISHLCPLYILSPLGNHTLSLPPSQASFPLITERLETGTIIHDYRDSRNLTTELVTMLKLLKFHNHEGIYSLSYQLWPTSTSSINPKYNWQKCETTNAQGIHHNTILIVKTGNNSNIHQQETGGHDLYSVQM